MSAPTRGSPWTSGTALVLGIAAARMALNLAVTLGDNYFRDEFYYLACARRLAWGYVDHPPLSIAILAATRALLGDGLVAIRLPVILAGGVAVVLAGLLTRAMGGGRTAQWLAALAVAVMGTSLVFSSYFSMNAFDQVFWLLAALIVARILGGGDERLWLLFGIVVGLGLLNKISVGFFVGGIVLGLALSPQRRHLISPWLWAGGAVAVAMLVPHLVWQALHRFPTAEFIRNAQAFKIVAHSPLAFLGAQVLEANPVTLPLWVGGLVALLVAPWLRPYRPLGIAFVAVLVVFLVQQAKPYYLAPAYPPLLAAGAIALERWQNRRQSAWPAPAVGVLLLAGGGLVSLLSLPILSPDAYARLAGTLGIEAPQEERHAVAELPQFLADRYGWENLAATVGRVYDALPPDERARAAILAWNYGQAGALEFYGPRYGLPPVISAHNNYWIWGPGTATGEVLIVLGARPQDLQAQCASVESAATVVSPHAVPRENNLPITICRGLRVPLMTVWRWLKRFV